MIDDEKNIAFWNRAAERSKPNAKIFAGMLMDDCEFNAIYRCEAEQRHFLSLLSSKRTCRILEVGSGGGRWAVFLANRVSEYAGLDISPKMVAVAEEECKRRNITNVTFECLTILDFHPHTKFDAVYFSGVLQYMDDDVVERSIAKAASLLSNEGIIISRDSVQTLERVEKTGDYPVIYRTIDEYRSLFETAGFALAYSAPSYQQKRFTGLAAKVYELPGVTYKAAYSFRELLCMVDDLLNNPTFLKTKKTKTRAYLVQSPRAPLL